VEEVEILKIIMREEMQKVMEKDILMEKEHLNIRVEMEEILQY